MMNDDFIYTKFKSIQTSDSSGYTFKPAGFVRVQPSLFNDEDESLGHTNSGVFVGKVYEVYEQTNTHSDICYFIVSPYTKDGKESKSGIKPFGLSGYYTEKGHMITWFNKKDYLSHVLPKEQWLKYILEKGEIENG